MIPSYLFLTMTCPLKVLNSMEDVDSPRGNSMANGGGGDFDAMVSDLATGVRVETSITTASSVITSGLPSTGIKCTDVGTEVLPTVASLPVISPSIEALATDPAEAPPAAL